MLIRIIKYVLNFAALLWMLLGAALSYVLILRNPDCDRVMDVIKDELCELIPIFMAYLAVVTGLNYLVERYLEKRKGSKEFLLLLLIQFVVMTLAITYLSFNFYLHCGEPN